MRFRKQKILEFIITFTIITTLIGCGKSNTVNNTNTIEVTQIATTQMSSEIGAESLSQSQEVRLSTDSSSETNIETNIDTNTETSQAIIIQEYKTQSETQTEPKTDAPFVEPESEVKNTDFVATLNVSKTVNQMIVVSANGTKANITMHEIQNGEWTQIMSTEGFVGKDGVGKASESAKITPAGVYTLSIAFGVNDNPGTALPYTKVDDSYYWVDDFTSPYYNKFVSINNVVGDWNSAEHIIDYPVQYAYSIAIDYNMNYIPGEGSAIFLHCANGSATYGCVSIPKNDMVFVLQHIQKGCVIVIDASSEIYKY